MPTKGYQTITLKTSIFDKLVEAYERKKRDLIMEDIKSYTAYAQKLLEKAIEQDSIEGRFEIQGRQDDTIQVKDYYKLRNAEVVFRQNKVYCRLDESGDCDHVGFVLSDPGVVRRATELGVRLRKAQTTE
ncbi:MAG TPA: hypothetical protein VN739_07830 [Nitrososphaerales archaeon]|nr:hypothetical protein [Nitrososphaerales archaeon]